jgi:hypothetical protein
MDIHRAAFSENRNIHMAAFSESQNIPKETFSCLQLMHFLFGLGLGVMN